MDPRRHTDVLRRLPVPALVLVLAVPALLAPAAAWAQATPRPAAAPPPAPEPARPGWMGFWYDVAPGPGGRPFVVVGRVEDGGPAARAGLDRGDTLLAVAGRVLSPAALRALGQGLRAGDALRLTVRRDGRRRDVEVVAAPRPGRLTAGPAAFTDSAHRVLLAGVDSLRTRVLLSRVPAADAPPLPPLPPTSSVGARPFHVFVWSADDSLTGRLAALEAEERAARVAEARRLRELAARVGAGGRVDGADAELRAHRERLRAARAEAGDVRRRIERAARERAREAAAPRAPVARPLTPYIVGQDRAAGARLTALNDGLSPYFGTGRGLLVVEVAAGTPAHEAGLVPGDVLTAAGGAPLADMADLRDALARAGAGPVVLSVLRKGRGFETRLP